MSDPSSISAILLLGLVFKIGGFAVRDELWLRTLVTAGLACDAIFYSLRPEPILQSVFTNGLLIVVNMTLICLILIERTTWRMSADDRDIYGHFPTMTPGQFRRLRKMMLKDTVAAEGRLLEEGQPVQDLLLILTSRIAIEKEGRTFLIGGPAFAGEIALMTGNPSSAGVSLPEGGTILRVPIAKLRVRMSRSPALSNAIIALFGVELARKVSDSTPMDRAVKTGRASGI